MRESRSNIERHADGTVTRKAKRYTGKNDGAARKFANEMISSGTVEAIRNEAGNIRYDYFFPIDDKETVLLIDSWENQKSIDFHHQSPMMKTIAELRNK